VRLAITLGLAFVVGCGGGARPSQTSTATAAPAPAADPALPSAPAPVAPPVAAVTPTKLTCVGAVEENSSPCAMQRQQHMHWHLHGYVEKQAQCFECWDEESSDCETEVPKSGYRYIGPSCGSVPPARR
jgi:hypothetical protein